MMTEISADYFKNLLTKEWKTALKDEFDKPYFKELSKFLAEEYKYKTVFPPANQIFNAFRFTPVKQVKVVIIGQDPYHGKGQAHGLAFSVKPGVKIPPSLLNIFKEIQGDELPNSGDLSSWAKQGVLLLNSVLTVEADKANSHKNHGWEEFTDAVLTYLAGLEQPLVIMLWGNAAKQKRSIFSRPEHLVLMAAHPSPLSAYRGFFGCRHFQLANQFLANHHLKQIQWRI